jgi:hypothetical protein
MTKAIPRSVILLLANTGGAPNGGPFGGIATCGTAGGDGGVTSGAAGGGGIAAWAVPGATGLAGRGIPLNAAAMKFAESCWYVVPLLLYVRCGAKSVPCVHTWMK